MKLYMHAAWNEVRDFCRVQLDVCRGARMNCKLEVRHIYS